MKRARTEDCPHRDDGGRCQWCADDDRADAEYERWKDERFDRFNSQFEMDDDEDE